MRKIMISGLAIGKAYDDCSACNYDFDWLIAHPSILLWIDELIISKYIWQVIQDAEYPNVRTGKAIKTMLDVANSHGIIKLFDPIDIITKEYSQNLYHQIDKDINLIKTVFPTNYKVGVERVPGAFILDNSEYCVPKIWSAYMSNALSNHFEAQCIYNEDTYKYFNYLLGADNNLHRQITTRSSFEKVFEVVVPNEFVVHNYAFITEEKCGVCANEVNCKDTYLKEIEQSTIQFLNYREYDEIQKIKEVTSNIVKMQQQNNGQLNPQEVKMEFINKSRMINNKMKKNFPKIERWSNLATILSIPVAIGGVYLSNPELTIASASVAGAATITKEGLNYLKSKNNWIGFVNSHGNNK